MAKFKATNEQKAIVKAVNSNNKVIVSALAGASKSVSKMLAVKHFSGKVLDVTFNKHLQVESENNKKKYNLHNYFPLTLHKLSKTFTIDKGVFYTDRTIKLYNYTIQKHIHTKDVWDIINKNNALKNTNAWDILRDIINYTKDPDYRYEDINTLTKIVYETLVYNKTITHDMYVKSFIEGLYMKKIDLSASYDMVCFDEVQDLSQILYKVVELHNIKKTLILGDPYQAINEFLLDGFSTYNTPYVLNSNSTKLTLTRTFRCTQEICNLALPYLHYLGYTGKYYGFDREFTLSKDSTKLVLNRTNLGVLSSAVDYYMNGKEFAVNIDKKELLSLYFDTVAVIKYRDDIDSMSMEDLQNSHIKEKVSKNTFKSISMFTIESTYGSVIKYLTDNGLLDIDTILQLNDVISKLSYKTEDGDTKKMNLAKFIQLIKTPNKKYKTTITTIHKSKGLEADIVQLENVNDFYTINKKFKELIANYVETLEIKNIVNLVENLLFYMEEVGIEFNKEEFENRFNIYNISKDMFINTLNMLRKDYYLYRAEIMLLYVAITRARYKIEFPKNWKHLK